MKAFEDGNFNFAVFKETISGFTALIENFVTMISNFVKSLKKGSILDDFTTTTTEPEKDA